MRAAKTFSVCSQFWRLALKTRGNRTTLSKFMPNLNGRKGLVVVCLPVHGFVCGAGARQHIFRLVINLQRRQNHQKPFEFRILMWGFRRLTVELCEFRHFWNLLKFASLQSHFAPNARRHVRLSGRRLSVNRIRRNYSFARDNPVVCDCCRRRCDNRRRIFAHSSVVAMPWYTTPERTYSTYGKCK